jgi:hypothetical protein
MSSWAVPSYTTMRSGSVGALFEASSMFMQGAHTTVLNYAWPGEKSGRCMTCGHHLVLQSRHIIADTGTQIWVVPDPLMEDCRDCIKNGIRGHRCSRYLRESTFIPDLPTPKVER